MEHHQKLSSPRVKRVRKKNSAQPKSLNLSDDGAVHSTPTKHKSCSQVLSSHGHGDVLSKPVKHKSCSQARKAKHTPPPAYYGGSSPYSGSPRSSFGVISPRGNRPPMMIGAGARPLPNPIISSVVSFESAYSSYDMESEVHFMRKLSTRRSTTVSSPGTEEDGVVEETEKTPEDK